MNDTTQPRTHLHSPLGDKRERAVACRVCRRSTWNICAQCGNHCDCPEVDALASMDAAVDALVGVVNDTLTEVEETVTLDVDRANLTDIRASIGMARLLADMAKDNPGSQSAWQMLTTCLAGIQAKVAALR
jgi:hypothetical protein